MSLEQDRGDGALRIKPHWRAFGVWYLAMLLLGTGPLSNPDTVLTPLQAFAVAMVIALGIAVKSKTSLLVVDRESITRQGGLIDRRNLSWPTSNLAQVKIAAGLTSRALGVGNLILEPRDDSPVISFWGVENPKAVKARIERLAGLG